MSTSYDEARSAAEMPSRDLLDRAALIVAFEGVAT
jgi:hypothetical protein